MYIRTLKNLENLEKGMFSENTLENLENNILFDPMNLENLDKEGVKDKQS